MDLLHNSDENESEMNFIKIIINSPCVDSFSTPQIRKYFSGDDDEENIKNL